MSNKGKRIAQLPHDDDKVFTTSAGLFSGIKGIAGLMMKYLRAQIADEDVWRATKEDLDTIQDKAERGSRLNLDELERRRDAARRK